MERLTKNLYPTSSQVKQYDIDNKIISRLSAINKLGQLEDIEEELGIDLITLFELKKRHKNKGKIYVITHDGKIADYTLTSYLDQINFVDEFIHIVSNLVILTTIYYFKDYGKTWALTKEELEKKR